MKKSIEQELADRNAFLRRYQGFDFYERDHSSLVAMKVLEIMEKGKLCHKIDFNPNHPANLNKAIERAKEWVNQYKKSNEMSKSKRKGSRENPLTIDDVAQLEAQAVTKEFSVMEAVIKDDFCHYWIEMTSGVRKGFTDKIKGVGIVKDDMKDAFADLRVHLAVIDDVFKHAGKEIKSISKMHNDDLTGLYNVTGFKIKGSEESERIILIGNKYLSYGGRMEMEGPPIPIDSSSSYKWYNELKEAADKVREEVSLYHGGKFTPVEKEDEDEEGLEQLAMSFKGNGKDIEEADME